jgi:hypothetical protein
MKTLTRQQILQLHDHILVGDTGDPQDEQFRRQVRLADNLNRISRCASQSGWDLESFADTLGEVLYDIPRTGEFATQTMVLARACIDYGLNPNLFTEFDT